MIGCSFEETLNEPQGKTAEYPIYTTYNPNMELKSFRNVIRVNTDQ